MLYYQCKQPFEEMAKMQATKKAINQTTKKSRKTIRK